MLFESILQIIRHLTNVKVVFGADTLQANATAMCVLYSNEHSRHASQNKQRFIGPINVSFDNLDVGRC